MVSGAFLFVYFSRIYSSIDRNGEFEMTTASSNNSFVEDGKLYIVPTLTSDVIGYNNVLDGYTYNITGCTNSNRTSLPFLPFLPLTPLPPLL